MLIKMLKSKIHRATVTDKSIHYAGSIRVDPELLDKAGLRAWENVLVVNVNNGTRHETYIQVGERGSGDICLNGAAARLGEVGDLVIIMAFAWVTPEEADGLSPQVALVDEQNAFVRYLT
jgi:aspartate 1-decarboxylase